jgi:hypothetical protein
MVPARMTGVRSENSFPPSNRDCGNLPATRSTHEGQSLQPSMRFFARCCDPRRSSPARVGLSHVGLASGLHTSRSGSRRSGSPWIMNVSPPTVNRSPGRGLPTSLARSSNVAVSAWMRVSPKPTIASGRLAMTRTDNGPAGRPRVDGIDPERGEGGVHRALERRHQVRLISTRGRVQIGSGLDCTRSMTQRANCWSTACLA